ncbi:sulfatase [Curtobacterium sp. MCSS17_015]|uniref:sulfatase family protein n=1 Tax=Curtobacterium sp. MCSS17_015 TaxID=2175666 RepID=UPI0011B3D77D|nr:sulfatase [Curtobacterium sp. MCSS17_015]WIB26720.1 sulfatase [Curtobacterium sp. MCSS17_015]
MAAVQGTRPDIVLVHGHDLGRWLTVYGMPSVPSTEIQAFADRSVVFDNAHAAAPLCSPARASLFTGLAPHRHGVQGLAHHQWRYRHNVLTAPERLRPLGYRSTLIGLQHENADPSVLGFDEVGGVGFLPRAHQVVDATSAWLEDLAPRAEREPLFLTVGVWEVHRPWPAEDYTPADPAAVDVPDYLPDNADTREDIAAFHGSIAQFDDAMGTLFRRIDEVLDPATTLVVFTTDHGAAFPRAKSTLYDAGTGVSFIVRPPTAWNVAPGRREQLVSHLDIVPTLLELAGGDLDAGLEGQSLIPVLADGVPDEDRAVVTVKSHHDAYDPIRAVRSRDFAYIRNFTDGPKLTLSLDLENSPTRRGMGDAHLEPRPREELYDRRVDPDELTNVAAQPEYAPVLRTFATTLDRWMDDTHDPVRRGEVELPAHRDREVDALPAVPTVSAPHPTITQTETN